MHREVTIALFCRGLSIKKQKYTTNLDVKSFMKLTSSFIFMIMHKYAWRNIPLYFKSVNIFILSVSLHEQLASKYAEANTSK